MESTEPQKDNDRPQGRLWSWFKKISVPLSVVYTLIALLGGIIVLADWFSDDYKIYATGDHYTIRYPDTLVNFFEYLGSNLESSKDMFAKLDFERTKGRLFDLNYMWVFNIRNEGSKNVTDLRLKVPFGGNYKVVRAGETPLRGEFNNVIKIGDLQPDNDISVTAWTNNFFADNLDYYEEKTAISHSNGTAKIRYPVQVFGFFASIYRNLFFWFALLIIVICLLISFKLVQSNKKQET